MAGKIDAFLKISIALSVLAAAGSIGYYYSVYLPARDAQIDAERKLELARAEYARQAEQARVAAERHADEQKEAANKDAIQTRYQRCLSNAENLYSIGWTDQCKRVSDNAQKQRADCLAKFPQGKGWCDSVYPKSDFNPNCTLLRTIGTDLNDQLEKAKQQCLQESRLGLR